MSWLDEDPNFEAIVPLEDDKWLGPSAAWQAMWAVRAAQVDVAL